MSDSKFRKSNSRFIVYTFIFLIVFSFAISGVQTGLNTPDSVGRVGDYKIKIDEYQRQLQQLIDAQKRAQGKDRISNKMIEELDLKVKAVQALQQRKLMFVWADKLKIRPSKDEISDTISELPYFKTNEKFDLNKYRSLLQANSIVPTKFEDDIRLDLKGRKVADFLQSFPISKSYLSQVQDLKNNKAIVKAITFSDSDLKKKIPITQSDLDAFLKDQTKKKEVETLFNTRKYGLSQQEEVKAAHILISANERSEEEAKKLAEKIKTQVNANNFSKLAKQHTEDPSGKSSGGDLGWFGKNRMVPEFDKTVFAMKKGQISAPVKTQFGYHIIYLKDKKEAIEAKLKDHQNDLAKELIRNNKKSELEALKTKEVERLQNLLSQDDKTIRGQTEKSGYAFLPNSEINFLNNKISGMDVPSKTLGEIFSNNKEKVHKINSNDRHIVFKVNKIEQTKPDIDTLEGERNMQQYFISQEISSEMIDELSSETPSEIYKKIL